MIQSLKLLLPALIPSWNFFDVIAASPRIEYALLSAPNDTPTDWLEFRPRPQHLSIPVLLARLLWNPRWNENLFVVSCAERLLEEPTGHSRAEIFHRIAADLKDAGASEASFLCFRIALLDEREGRVVKKIAFVSESRALAEIETR